MAIETHSHTVFRKELKERPYYRCGSMNNVRIVS